MSENSVQSEVSVTNKSNEAGFESNLIKIFEEICRHACEMIGVDHSGFVRFDNLNEVGEVVAQHPNKDGLIGRKIKLRGIPAEERLLDSEKPLVINDVESARDLGEVGPLLREFDIRSLCIVKVKFYGVVIGSFSLDSIGKTREFTPEEIALCSSFAELASKTIENAQLVDWLEAFQKATVAITLERELDPLLKKIIEQAELLFSAQSVGLYQRSPDEHGEDSLRIAASSDDDLTGKILRKDEGMAWQLIKSKEPFMTTSDYDTYKHRAGSLEGKFGSVLEVPMLRQGERIGVIFLSDVKGRKFTEFDAHLLQRFADMATIAHQHCSLVARMKELSIASTDISRDFGSETLDVRLSAIAFHTTKILNAEMCGVFRVENPEKLVLQASYGHEEGFFTPDQPFEIRDEPQSGLTGAIAARLIDAHAKHRQADPHSNSDIRNIVFNTCGESLIGDQAVKGTIDATPSGKCHSLLAIPLITKTGEVEQVTGMLRISNKKGADGVPHDSICFNDEDEWILRIFAEAVVVAIESAKLFDELKAQQDELQIQKDELKAQKELYGQLLDTWNTLVSEDSLEHRLEKIAKNLLTILGKSFCRILLAEESEEFLTLKAAAVHPRQQSNNLIRWNADKSKRTSISEWPHLKGALHEGQPYELTLNGYPHPDETLVKLSALLELRDGNSDHPLQIQSLFSIPMTVGSRPVGVLNIGELRKSKDRRNVLRGKDRRSVPQGGFTNNQKNTASAIAAQATIMIDREWRGQTTKRREQLLSRLFEALVTIRAEADSSKKLTVIAEQARSVFGCQLGGLLVQSMPNGPFKLVISSPEHSGTAEEADVEATELNDLLSSEPLIDNKSVSSRFGDICPSLPVLAGYALKTCLAVRFEYAARSRCVLFIGDGREVCELTSADLSVLEELANHCSTSLTRAAMREQLTKARDGVNQVAIDLALGDQHHALKNVVEGICNATDSQAVTLYTVSATDNEIEITAAPTTTGLLEPQKAERYTKPVLESPVGRILKKNDLYFADDAASDEVMAGGFVEREKIKSSMGTPIWLPSTVTPDSSEDGIDRQPITAQAIVGVLFVNYRIPHKFTKDDEKIIKMFAQLAAVAIRNQELFEQERRKATTLEALYDASKAISGSLNLTEILGQIADGAFRVGETLNRKVSLVAINLFEDGKAKIHATHPVERLSEIKQKIDLEPAGSKRGIVGRAYEDRCSQLVGDVSQDTDYREIDTQTKSQIVALIGEELCPNVSPVGAITVESQDINAFDEEDFRAFKSLAALANDAIRNARQFSEREYALDREANLKDLALYYVKCGILIHNQKAHVEAIKQDGVRLEAYADQYRPDAETKTIISAIVDHSRSLEFISNSAELSTIQWDAIDLDVLVEDWRSRLPMRSDVGDVDLKVLSPDHGDKKIRVDLLLMRHVLKVFVDNSISAMRGLYDKALRIQVTSDSQGWCSIFVSDTGRGMNKNRWKEVSAGKNPTYGGDTRPRKGLRTALLIITGFSGEIRLINADETGTTYEIRLPLYE